MSVSQELRSRVICNLIRFKQILGEWFASGARVSSDAFGHVRSLLSARFGQGAQDGPGSGSHASLDRVVARMMSPEAQLTITRLYVALVLGGVIARLVGIPWPLVVVPLLAQGLLQIVLVVAVVGSWLSRLPFVPRRASVLRHLRVALAVGLFWLAGLSFALGQAILPATRVEAAASAPAETISGPPIVSRSTMVAEPDSGVSCGPVRNPRSARGRARSRAASGLV